MIFGFSILMGLLARVAIPLPFTPVPVTGQTFGVLLAGAVLGGPAAAAAMLLYLAQLLGPTGGFLLSYPLAAFLTGFVSRRARLLVALLCGEAVIFLCGAVWLGALGGRPAAAVFQAAVWPFLPGEVLKMALVLALAAGFRARRPAGERLRP